MDMSAVFLRSYTVCHASACEDHGSPCTLPPQPRWSAAHLRHIGRLFFCSKPTVASSLFPSLKRNFRRSLLEFKNVSCAETAVLSPPPGMVIHAAAGIPSAANIYLPDSQGIFSLFLRLFLFQTTQSSGIREVEACCWMVGPRRRRLP